MMIKVNQDSCSQCGLCTHVCSSKIIVHKEGKFPRMIPGADKFCIKCGHCVGICPTGSLTHSEIPVENCPPIRPELQISAAQCAQFIRSRRSIREYKNQLVPRSTLQQLIDIAHYAPTGHNNQDVEWLVIDSRERLLEIEKISLSWMQETIEKNPPMAAHLNFHNLLKVQAEQLNTFLREAPLLIGAIGDKKSPMAAIDCVIATTTLELAATSLGLGCCWAGMVYFMANSYPPVQQILEIPEGKAVYAFIMVGYPKIKYSRMIARKAAGVHWLDKEAQGN
jgi:nitroreductase/NAD-dependent dihydropyrimidine dehydrogenase PreA subunit